MKSLKYILILFICSNLLTSNAQTSIFKAGLNLSTVQLHEESQSYREFLNLKPGLLLGATQEYTFSESISFESGLLFSSKGYNLEASDASDTAVFSFKEKVDLFYLEIPANIKVSFNIGNPSIFCKLGPYFAMGLIGKSNYSYTSAGQTKYFHTNLDWGNGKKGTFRQFDYGITAGTGIEFKNIQLAATYQFGLTNLNYFEPSGIKRYNQVIGVSVGYLFKK